MSPAEIDVAFAPPDQAETIQRVLARYLKSVASDTASIPIRGISSEPGEAWLALYCPIEELYTPLRVCGGDVACTIDGGLSHKVPLKRLFGEHRHLLIVGAPGAGKTTFARLVASSLARDLQASGPPLREEHLGLSLATAPPLPIFLRVARIADTLVHQEPGTPATYRGILEHLRLCHGAELSELAEELLERGRCLLLLDGLDEVADPKLRELVLGVIRSALEQWKANRIVVTSRPYGFEAIAGIEGVHRVRIDDLDPEDIREFLDRWVARLPEAVIQAGERSKLEAAVIGRSRIRRMARNPTMLTCLCVLHWIKRRLPGGGCTGALSAVRRWLLGASKRRKEARRELRIFVMQTLRLLASNLGARNETKRGSIEPVRVAEQIESLLKRHFPQGDGAGPRRARVRFLPSETLGCGAGPPEDGLLDPRWNEIVDHFTAPPPRRDWEQLDVFVRGVLSLARGDDLETTARVFAALGRILNVLGRHDGYVPREGSGWAEARDRCLVLFTKEGAAEVAYRDRIAATEAVAVGGDPRFPSSRATPELLEVPPLATEGRRYLLGKYPVTVEEYRRFLTSDEYGEPELWHVSDQENPRKLFTDEKGWRRPAHWDDQLRYGNRPVTGLSWFEARAYCRWLARITGVEFRLPDSEERGVAAGLPEREYPWGNSEPTVELANCGNTFCSPSPVGAYPCGVGPFGHLDLSGNVWEWCENLYSVDTNGDGWYVLRGGSFGEERACTRSSAQVTVPASCRRQSIGFRVCALLAL